MSTNENFSKISECENGESERLPHTQVTGDVVCLDEEIKSFQQEDLRKQLSNEHTEMERDKFKKEEHNRVFDDVVIFVEDGSHETGKQNDKEEERGSQQDEINIKEETKLTNTASTERFPTLAEPEESDSETDEQERLILRENFDECEKCFKILEENSTQLTKFNCAENITSEEEKCCKFPHNVDPDSSGSFRASIRSLSTCHDSISSARGCPSKKDLFLDLECRICHDAEGQDLISPCHCAGTSKWVHESCIIRWIRHTKTKQCEICTCPITVKRKKKPVDQWIRPSAQCGPCNKLDIWYCFVLALCVLIIIGFVVLQSHYDVTDQIETTVIFASIYVLCGMIIMMKARYFWTWFVQRSSFWGNWKNLNEEWRIVEANEPNFQSPISPV